MTVTESPRGAGLTARVRGILMHPRVEWAVIDGEPATVSGLFTGYACILALIPAAAVVLRGLLVVRWTALPIVLDAVLTYVVSLLSAYVVGFIIDAFAPTFDGQKNRVQAMKLSVYAYTASWVGSIFNVVPWIGWVAALAMAIYGLYILYLGLPMLMRCPTSKTAGYFALVLVAAVVITMVLTWLVVLLTLPLIATTALTGIALAH